MLKEKLLKILNKEIPQPYAVLIISVFELLAGMFLYYQYWKIYQIFG